MPSISAPRVLLKARPTPAQMADRLAAPVPDGVELYLAAEDVSGDDWLPRLERVWSSLVLPPDFTVIVEGPLRGLDGAFFDITMDSDANQELIRRLVSAAMSLGAVAVNVHAIAPTHSFPVDYSAANQRARERSLPLLAIPSGRVHVSRDHPIGREHATRGSHARAIMDLQSAGDERGRYALALRTGRRTRSHVGPVARRALHQRRDSSNAAGECGA